MFCRVCEKRIYSGDKYRLFVEPGNDNPGRTNHHEYAHVNCEKPKPKRLNARIYDRGVTVPQYFHDHYVATGECIHCRHELKHSIHAFRHWKMWHRDERVPTPAPPKQKFFIWDGFEYVEVGIMTFLVAQYNGKAVAYTKM